MPSPAAAAAVHATKHHLQPAPLPLRLAHRCPLPFPLLCPVLPPLSPPRSAIPSLSPSAFPPPSPNPSPAVPLSQRTSKIDVSSGIPCVGSLLSAAGVASGGCMPVPPPLPPLPPAAPAFLAAAAQHLRDASTCVWMCADVGVGREGWLGRKG
eukprot:365336-Chlamydomonas_euryale.AAC.2